MTAYIESIVLPLIALIINCTVLLQTFPKRYSLNFSVGVIALFTAALYLYDFLTGAFGKSYGGVRGILYIPLITWLLKGIFFQKIFIVCFQLSISMMQSYLAAAVILLFIPAGSYAYYIALFIAVVSVYAVYVVLMLKFGRLFMERLFASGSSSEWALYSFGLLFSFAIFLLIGNASVSPVLYFLFLLFIIWSLGVLCFAIINTHEKSRQRYEAEFARDIISSGSGHYQKMNEMFDSIRILRHDYKYHLSVVQKLLSSGNTEEINKYLTDAQIQLSDKELINFCTNPVINALLTSYAERCSGMNISYSAEVSLPDAVSVPNFEICIVLGNLLENAVESCEKKEDNRKIELIVKQQGAQLAIKTKNSFDSSSVQGREQSASTKKDGGLGLRSVHAVVSRYNGEMLTEWDADTFTVYVLMSL